MLNIDNLKNRGNNLSLDLQVRNIIRRQSLAFNGVWYDPSDLSTMFQDSAGTVPVTGVGQPVGLILDKSGRGNHATQTTAGFKPLLHSENGLNYLAFDGADDFLVTGNIDFSSSDKIAVAAGVRKLSDATVGIVCELSATTSLNGRFNIAAPGGAGVPSYSFNAKGTVAAIASVGNSYPAPITTIVSAANVISLDSTIVRANGEPKNSTATDCGTGNFGNYPLYIGRRGGTSLPFNGRLYGLAICGGMDDIYKLKKIERFLAQKTGVII